MIPCGHYSKEQKRCECVYYKIDIKDDLTPVSVFICDLTRHTDKKELARNALKKAKTIRHPNILKFIDGIETETQIIIGTEYVEPLSASIRENQNADLICWGLYKIAVCRACL